MKKNILLLLGALLFSTSSLGANKESNFYLKTIVGGHKLSNIKTINPEINFALNQGSTISPVFGFGIGYYINSFSRVDLTFEHSKFAFEHKDTPFNYSDNYGLTKGRGSIRRKSNSQSIMLNGYVDIIKHPAFKVFIGGGIGVTNLKEKVSTKFSEATITNGVTANLDDIETVSTNKKKSNFSYGLITGLEKNVCHNVNIELAYRWKYHGKAKHDDAINKYHGHNLAFSIRFDL